MPTVSLNRRKNADRDIAANDASSPTVHACSMLPCKLLDAPQSAGVFEDVVTQRRGVARPGPEGVAGLPAEGRRGYAPPWSRTTRRAEAKSMPMLTDLGHTTTSR